MKKLMLINKKNLFSNMRFFVCENYHPTRHMKCKVINFASNYKSVMANKLRSTN